jgi:two-component sensor histidine kinase
MIQTIAMPASQRSVSEANLLLHEFSHRMNNELASMIATLCIATARAKNDEAKAALNIVQDQLHGYAQVNQALRIPERSVRIDAAAYLRELCRAISRSKLDAKETELIFVDIPLQMNSERCWRLGLILSELITNAARHAFPHGGGIIRVEILSLSSLVACRVTDNGNGNVIGRPGHGSQIVRALVESLDGTIDQHFGVRGAITTVIFPSDL